MTSSYIILLLFQVQIHSTITFIRKNRLQTQQQPLKITKQMDKHKSKISSLSIPIRLLTRHNKFNCVRPSVQERSVI